MNKITEKNTAGRKKTGGIGSEKWISKIFSAVVALLCFLAIMPCLHVICKAVSNGTDITSGNVYFWPKGFQLETITYILTQTQFFMAMKNSLLITAVGTVLSLLITITTAYPLSKASFKGRRLITLLYVISMVFYGGMIPAYMVVRSLGLLDTYAACILPFAIVQFNMFIVKNYFESLPESVEESARIDGAGDFRTLVSIVCPMSKPVIATVGLLYAIGYWNNYFHVMMYTTSANKNTLQVYLYNIINNSQAFTENMAGGISLNITSEGMVAAAVSLSIIPMMILYPFVSRYLIQGMTVGSVKG